MLFLYVFVTGVTAGYCLLAIWVAIGRGHWFVRASVLLAALALLVPIRAYEPLILFGMTSVMLVGGWSVVKGWEELRRRDDGGKPLRPAFSPRFRLRDALLACAVAAVASWMISVLVKKGVTVDWRSAIGSAAIMAGVSSLSVSIVRYSGWWWRLPVLISSVVAAGAIHVVALDCWWDRAEMLGILTGGLTPADIPYAVMGFSILMGTFAIWSLVIAVLATASVRDWKRPMFRMVVRGTCAVIVTVAMVCLGWVYWRMLDVPQWSPESADRPNALPRICELARAAEKAPLPAQADAIYAELFELLDQPSFVVWPKVRPTTAELSAGPGLFGARTLTRGLKVRRNVFTAQDRFDEAGDQRLAVLRLAPMLDGEGTAIHRWEAEAIRHMGHAWLAEIREKLSPDKSREAAELILKIAESREPMEATMLRDKIWNDRFTWRDMLRRVVLVEMQLMEWPEPMERETEAIAIQEQCFARLVAIDLLVRSHRSEHGRLPASLDEIALRDLPEMLTDPYSGERFIYRPTAQGFLLYSVGESGVDAAGVLSASRNIWAQRENPLTSTSILCSDRESCHGALPHGMVDNARKMRGGSLAEVRSQAGAWERDYSVAASNTLACATGYDADADADA